MIIDVGSTCSYVLHASAVLPLQLVDESEQNAALLPLLLKHIPVFIHGGSFFVAKLSQPLNDSTLCELFTCFLTSLCALTPCHCLPMCLSKPMLCWVWPSVQCERFHSLSAPLSMPLKPQTPIFTYLIKLVSCVSNPPLPYLIYFFALFPV